MYINRPHYKSLELPWKLKQAFLFSLPNIHIIFEHNNTMLLYLSRVQIYIFIPFQNKNEAVKDAVFFMTWMYIRHWQQDACLLRWDDRSGWDYRSGLHMRELVTFVPLYFLFDIWTSEYDHAGSFATVGAQDTHAVSRCVFVSAPQSDLAALGEVHPPSHPQCLYHPLLWGVLLPSGQF